MERWERVDDLCAQLGCLDGGLCFREGRHAHLAAYDEPGEDLHCHRALALKVGPAAPYSLRLAVWRAFLRRVGLLRLLPREPYRG